MKLRHLLRPTRHRSVGDYDVKMADGKMGKTTINADGTYVDTGPDGKEIKGKFAMKDGKECFDADGDEAEVCWTSTKPACRRKLYVHKRQRVKPSQ